MELDRSYDIHRAGDEGEPTVVSMERRAALRAALRDAIVADAKRLRISSFTAHGATEETSDT